ncbi:unnamed protein product, partial [Effrenium voratum]
MHEDASKAEAAHAIQLVEAEGVIKRDIEMLQEAVDDVRLKVDVPAEPDVEPECCSESGPRTLSQILSGHGLHSFSPPDNDNQKLAMRRVRRLMPAFSSFVRDVRASEGFLSRSQVFGLKRPLSEHAQQVRELSICARQAELAGHRQSRAQAWASCSAMVAGEAAKRAGSDAAQQVQTLRPSCTREYQFVAARMHPCGKVQPALVERVWTAKAKKTQKAKTVHVNYEVEGSIEADRCSWCHICLLEPVGPAESGVYWLHCGHEATAVNPHGGQILYEIPQCQLTCREADVYLHVQVSKRACRAMEEVQGQGWVVESSTEVAGSPTATVFTYDAFHPTKRGKENIMEYMGIMKSMYDRVSKTPLLKSDGTVAPLANSRQGPPLWRELVARTPGFIEIVAKQGGMHKKQPSAAEISNGVWAKFAAVAP